MIAVNNLLTMTTPSQLPSDCFTPTSVLTHLGEVAVADFLANDWHVKPRLFRQAFGNMPIAPLEDILPLACDHDVESRLITCFDGQWDLQSGPFKKLPAKSKKNWTVLIQGLNLHIPQANQLLEQFRFVPDARLDDVMMSFASDGGGVGPHFDSYDVFLLQMHGKRQWRIGAQQDLSLRDDLPLKILSDFQPTEEFVLEPGDMLYLPPHYAHDGVAIGPCATLSIGFRAPNAAETLAAVLRQWADAIESDSTLQNIRFADPKRGVLPEDNPAQLPAELKQWVTEQLAKQNCSAEMIADGLAQYLTEPKQNVFFIPPEESVSEKYFLKHIKQSGIRLSARSRLIYCDSHYYINGEKIDPELMQFKPLIQTLANQRGLTAAQCSSHAKDTVWVNWLYDLYDAGWLKLPEASDDYPG